MRKPFAACCSRSTVQQFLFGQSKNKQTKKNRLNTNFCSHYKSSAIAALTKEINKFVVVKKDDNSFSVFVSQDNRRHDLQKIFRDFFRSNFREDKIVTKHIKQDVFS